MEELIEDLEEYLNIVGFEVYCDNKEELIQYLRLAYKEGVYDAETAMWNNL